MILEITGRKLVEKKNKQVYYEYGVKKLYKIKKLILVSYSTLGKYCK
jgi:hypothetical protein